MNYMDQLDQSAPLYDQLVGENRPYADNEAFARSRIEANLTIQQREDELARLRAELETRINYEDFLEEFRKERDPNSSGNHTERTGNNQTPATTLQDIERIVEQREQRIRQETNLTNSMSKYSEVNGPNSALKLKQQATELGMSEDALKSIAATNPKAFFKLTGVGETTKQDNTFSAPPRTTLNTATFDTNKPRNPEADYFKQLYKEKPLDYWSAANQNKIMKAVAEGRLDAADVM